MLSEHDGTIHRIADFKFLSGYLIELIFEDGLRKVVDLEPYIGRGIAAQLLDEAYFRQVAIESGGGLAWPNGYDFCPNFLYSDVPSLEPVVTE